MNRRTTTVLDIREILRHLQQGRSDRAIRDALGVGRRTVAKYRQWANDEGLLKGPLPSPAELQARLAATQTPPPPQTTSSVEPYRAVVEDLRRRGVEIEAIRQRLRENHGYPGSYASVWRFVRALEPDKPQATVRIEVPPGDEAQVDFGFAGRMYDPLLERVRRAWAFVMTLSWSRHQFVEFVFDQRVATWVELHRHAFQFFQGTPRRVVLDNLKAAIVKACWDDPQVQRAYRDCAEHYGFLIAPCKVATPQHKGKVEKGGVHYVQRNFLGGREYTTPQHSLRQANQDVLDWAQTTAGLRVHGTTKQAPWERFLQVEHAALLPLPPTPFEVVTWKQAKLHRDCHIEFEKSYYSAPHRLIGQRLWVRGTAKSVQLYADFDLVATHSRASQPGERQTVLAHLPPEKVAGVTLTPQACQTRAAAIGPHTAQAVAALLAEHPIDRLRAVQRLLALTDTYGAARLERACARALEFGDVSVRTLRTLLASGLADEAPSAAVTYWPIFARTAEELVPASGGEPWN
jgi:transposase